MKRKITALVLAAFVLVSLCGCDLFTVDTDELLSPPQLSGEMYPIGQALKAAAGENYTLKYPVVGESRSAVALEDIDGDGVSEAFAFYTVNEGDEVTMHLNLIKKKGKKWKSVSDAQIAAGDVDRVEFCDLTGDGKKEILAGFEIYGSSEKKLGIYEMGKEGLSEKFFQQYTKYLCCDLDTDGQNELFLQLLSVADGTNKATVYSFADGGIAQICGAIMDGGVKAVQNILVTSLDDGTPAIFVDEAKGVGAVSEVLFIKDGELKNPFLNPETFENTETARYLNINCEDINGDGKPEIPISANLPSAKSTEEKIYYTNWCSFGGETLAVQKVSVINAVDGYRLYIPETLVGKIAVDRNDKERTRTFFEYDEQTGTVGQKIFEIFAVKTSKYQEVAKSKKGMFKLYQNETTCFAAVIFKKDVLKNELKAAFEIIN